MIRILKIQALLTISATLFAYFIGGGSAALSLLVGCVITALNIVSMGFISNAILKKKSIAQAFLVVVFKYPLLIGVLYKLIRERLVDANWLLLGLGTLLVTGLVSALFQKESAENEQK
jgi:hypothetical protein